MANARSGAGGAGARTKRAMDLCAKLIGHLQSRNDILLVTTSNRYPAHAWDVPKSTQLARRIRDELVRKGRRVTLLDVAKLRIHTCEGNISGKRGNRCGTTDAALPDRRKNPTGQHRCWASLNNPDDQLYKVSRELFRSQAVVFFVSVRWGQTNSVYQRLLERLSWIENRFTTLREAPIPQLKGLEAGLVVFGHNWNGGRVLDTQKQNLRWFGWETPAALSFSWQYTPDAEEEAPGAYLGAVEEFETLLQVGLPRAHVRPRGTRAGRKDA